MSVNDSFVSLVALDIDIITVTSDDDVFKVIK